MTDSFFLEGPAGFENYEYRREAPGFQEERNALDEMWRLFRDYADADFRERCMLSYRDIQRHFWEMYLGATLVRSGKGLQIRGMREGPDLAVEHTEQTPIFIECVCPDGGQGVDAVPSLEDGYCGWIDGADGPDLRFLSAILDKRKKFDRYLKKGIVQASAPCIVAVNGILVDAAVINGEQRMVRLGFGLGSMMFQVSIGEGGRRNGRSFHEGRTLVKSRMQRSPQTFLPTRK